MPATFVLAIVTVLLALASRAVSSMFRRQPQTKTVRVNSYGDATKEVPTDAAVGTLVFRWTARGFLALTVLLTVVSSYTPVSTKNVGIVTEFGKPTSSLSNGVHFIAPWAKVTEMDAAIQTDKHTAASKDDPCITVRIAHQATACADVIIKWRVDESTAGVLFQNYRDFENVRDSLITTDLQSAMNQAFGDYDALAVDTDGNSTSPGLPALANQVLSTMKADVGSLAEIQSIQIPVVHFDGTTQDKLNQLQAAIAQTRIATQSQKTAAAEAQANQILSASVDNSTNVLVSKCLDLVAKGIQLPAGFSCFPSNIPVTVPVK